MQSFQLSSRRLSPAALQRRYLGLSVVSSPIIGAYFLGATQTNSPLICPILALTGIPCPSCGMTRSFVAIARGEMIHSLSYHGLGLFLFLGFVLAALHFAIEIISRRTLSGRFHHWLWRYRVRWGIAIVASLFIYHTLRLAFLIQTGELTASNFLQSPLGQWISSLTGN